MNSSTKRTFAVVKSLVYLQAAGAAALSFMHIVEVGSRYGLGWQAWIAPFLIDGFAVLGTIGRSAVFAESTRKTGFRLMVGAGLVSLVCNVEAGSNIGQRVFGVLVVAGFVTAEWYASKLKPAAVKVPAEAPVSPGTPPAPLEAPEVLAFREAQRELRKTSKLPALNGAE